MKKFIHNITIIVLIAFSSMGNAQDDLKALLDRFNDSSVPYMSVQELAMPKTAALVLDAREQDEYDVSHLKGAVFVGHNGFKTEFITKNYPDKNQKVIVYCSLGVRSENIAEKLMKAGYTDVYNLFGGIFEWKNKGYTVYDLNEKETEKVHVFNSDWGKWLINGQKVY